MFDLQGEGGSTVTEEQLKDFLIANMDWVWNIYLAAMLKEAKTRIEEQK